MHPSDRDRHVDRAFKRMAWRDVIDELDARTDAQRDELLLDFLETAWPTKQAQNQ